LPPFVWPCRLSFFSHKAAQYFKSIEAVANELGYQQMLPSADVTGAKRNMIIEELNSPKSVSPPDSAIHLKAPELPIRPRSVTPELVPDRMASRIPALVPQLDGSSVPEDLPMQRMADRIAG
jgi:glucosamine-6-phosphate deaminase